MYISVTDIEIEIENYFKILMQHSCINIEDRIYYITPTTLCKTIMKSAAKSLYLSSRSLVDLKNKFCKRSMVIVPYKTTEFDEYLGDFLKVPILGCTSNVFSELSQINRRKLIESSGLLLIPGICGNFTYQEFNENLQKLKDAFPKRQ